MSINPISGDWFYELETHCAAPNYLNDKGQRIINTNFVAQVIADAMQLTYRYSAERKKWFIYDSQSWVEQKTVYMDVLKALESLRHAIRIRLTNDGDNFKRMNAGWEQILGNAFVKTAMANIELMTSMYVSDTAFDTHKTLLNTPGGLYDLKSRTPINNSASYLCKNMTTVTPLDDKDGKLCPEYMKHLEFVTEGRQDLIAYLEALSGYILTGETFMQEFYWFQGVPKTGKSALADIWFYILGSYREIGYPRQFAEVQNEPHAEADYRLIGKRFIYTDEPKVKQWDGEKLKAFTGSTARVGRPMYGDSINFYPIGKLLFSSNDKPQINGADEGVGRRLRLIPFTRQIPETMRNRLFVEEKLHPEAPYILYRMMQSAQKVLAVRNLPECVVVTQTSQDYMNDNDIIRQFISECCSTEQYDTETTKVLYTAFGLWCNENSYDIVSQNKFGRMLSGSGYELSRTNAKRLRTKIKLNSIWSAKAGAPVMDWEKN